MCSSSQEKFKIFYMFDLGVEFILAGGAGTTSDMTLATSVSFAASACTHTNTRHTKTNKKISVHSNMNYPTVHVIFHPNKMSHCPSILVFYLSHFVRLTFPQTHLHSSPNRTTSHHRVELTRLCRHARARFFLLLPGSGSEINCRRELGRAKGVRGRSRGPRGREGERERSAGLHDSIHQFRPNRTKERVDTHSVRGTQIYTCRVHWGGERPSFWLGASGCASSARGDASRVRQTSPLNTCTHIFAPSKNHQNKPTSVDIPNNFFF
jgi:hypothetical protein